MAVPRVGTVVPREGAPLSAIHEIPHLGETAEDLLELGLVREDQGRVIEGLYVILRRAPA